MSAGREIQYDVEDMSTQNSKSTRKIGLQQPRDPQDGVDFYNSYSSADIDQAAKVVASVAFSSDTLLVFFISKEMSTQKSKTTGKIGLQQLRDFQNDEDFNNSHSSVNNAQAANIAPSVSFSSDTLFGLIVKYQDLTHKLIKLVISTLSAKTHALMASSPSAEVDSELSSSFANIKKKTNSDIMKYIPRKFHVSSQHGNKNISILWVSIHSELLSFSSFASVSISILLVIRFYSTRNVSPYPNDKLLSRPDSSYERQIIKTQQSINYYPISSELHVYHSRSIYSGAIWEFTTTLQQFTATVSTDVTPCKTTSGILAPVLYFELHFLSSFASVSISILFDVHKISGGQGSGARVLSSNHIKPRLIGNDSTFSSNHIKSEQYCGSSVFSSFYVTPVERHGTGIWAYQSYLWPPLPISGRHPISYIRAEAILWIRSSADVRTFRRGSPTYKIINPPHRRLVSDTRSLIRGQLV